MWWKPARRASRACGLEGTPGSVGTLDEWFRREILSQEQALRRYLTRSWRNRDETDDLRQETYVRVYEAAAKERPAQPKAFLFATARNLMTDRIRRRRVVAIDPVADLDTVSYVVDDNSPEAYATVHEELRRLAEALDTLPPRCRQVVWLRRIDDLSQKEVASQLGIAQKTVEKHVMRGMKLLDQALSNPSFIRNIPDSG